MVVIIATIFFVPKKIIAAEFYQNQAGIWVVRHNLTTKEKIDRLVASLKEISPQNVYLQVRGRGYAYYNSTIEPKSPTIESDFDPLEYFLEKTDTLDFKTHLWINTYLLWTSPKDPADKNHLYFKHPEWFEITLKPPKNKKVRNIYLSPHVPAVRNYLLSIIDELINNYNIDGIHLDYIRYDNKYYGFHKIGLEEYFSIFQKTDDSKWKLINDKNWIEYKSSKVDILVEDICSLKTGKKPNIILSAAVKPDPEKAYTQFGQNWTQWLDKGILDYVVIMNYTTNNELFTKNLSLINQKCDNLKVFIGIGLWNKNESKTIRQMEICKKRGFGNIVLFSFDTVVEKYQK